MKVKSRAVLVVEISVEELSAVRNLLGKMSTHKYWELGIVDNERAILGELYSDLHKELE